MTKPAFIYRIIDCHTGAYSHVVAISAEEAVKHFPRGVVKVELVGPAPDYKQPVKGENGYAAFD